MFSFNLLVIYLFAYLFRPIFLYWRRPCVVETYTSTWKYTVWYESINFV